MISNTFFRGSRVQLKTIIVVVAVLHNIATLEGEDIPPIDPDVIQNHNNIDYNNAELIINYNTRNDKTRHALINNFFTLL